MVQNNHVMGTIIMGQGQAGPGQNRNLSRLRKVPISYYEFTINIMILRIFICLLFNDFKRFKGRGFRVGSVFLSFYLSLLKLAFKGNDSLAQFKSN